MSFAATILTDSVTPTGHRLTTFQITFPRIVLAEFNTHRMLSRNSASSRAIPIKKMIERVENNPYIPTHWGSNKPGMQAGEEIENPETAKKFWLVARDHAISMATGLDTISVHKQTVNRLLEPFMWHTVIVTATEWMNFFNLRCHKDAHPDISTIAHIMLFLYNDDNPKLLDYGEWHMPFTTEDDCTNIDDDTLKKLSIARCARVSYLTHDGERDIPADLKLYDRLLSGGHMSPFEHVARPLDPEGLCELKLQGNFLGWAQYRKMIPGEDDILGSR